MRPVPLRNGSKLGAEMLPHLPVHDLRDIGTVLDVVQLTLLVALAYLLWCLVRMVRQLQAIGRFYVRNWWATFEVTIDEAAGDRSGPQCASMVSPPVHSSDP
jgi:hypothetical protein